MSRGPHVLLVEDSPTTARATARLLTDGGITAEVVIVTDIEAALAHLRSVPVDLVVLDLALRDHHGLDLLADVRTSEAWSTLPVVVFSGVLDPDIVRRTYELGANCFVRKPTKVVELAPAVRAIEQFWARRTGPTTPGIDRSMFQLPLAATADSVREARAIVRHLLDGWGLAVLGETAELCTSELATNAVLHAHTPVLMVVSLLTDGVRIEIEDEAPGVVKAGSLDGDGEGGRGLAIVDALSECWGVDQREEGKTVWFELQRPDPAATA